MTLRVLDAGWHTLIVDFGRSGCRGLGVPLGGAADQFGLAVANALVGNPPDAAALEISLTGPTLQAECELGCVVHGAPFTLTSDRQPLQPGTTFSLSPGEHLHIGATPRGLRAYLCVRGGIRTKRLFHSSSSLEPIQAGMELPCLPGRVPARFVRLTGCWEDDPKVLRALPGPQTDWFDGDTFFQQEFRVTPASNRMGLRLQGPALAGRLDELLSEPVCPGVVQVTRDRQVIILGVDGQTIGGYPKIAQVIRADLDLLGQLRPGEVFRFRRVSLDEAERLHHLRQRECRQWVLRLRTALP